MIVYYLVKKAQVTIVYEQDTYSYPTTTQLQQQHCGTNNTFEQY